MTPCNAAIRMRPEFCANKCLVKWVSHEEVDMGEVSKCSMWHLLTAITYLC